MPAKKRFPLLILLVVLLASGVYIFSRPKKPEVNCASLSEFSCLDNSSYCYPAYVQEGPSSDESGTSLLNYTFTSCIAFTKGELKTVQKEKKDCKDKKGDWIATFGNPKGFCVVSSN